LCRNIYTTITNLVKQLRKADEDLNLIEIIPDLYYGAVALFAATMWLDPVASNYVKLSRAVD